MEVCGGIMFFFCGMVVGLWSFCGGFMGCLLIGGAFVLDSWKVCGGIMEIFVVELWRFCRVFLVVLKLIYCGFVVGLCGGIMEVLKWFPMSCRGMTIMLQV
jgi:hypothetical protein